MTRLAPYRKALPLLAALSLTGLFLACDSSDDNPAPPAPTPSIDAGGVGCDSDPRVTPFATGIKAQSASGNLVVELLGADPSPPHRGAGDAGMNAWKVRITSGGQAPTETVTVTTLMPDHGHGSPKVPVLTPNGDGTSAVSDLFLFMGGVWEISFSTSPQEIAKFTFCVD